MASFSMMFIFFLLTLSTGSYSTDLVSLIDAEPYFKSHQIDVKAADLAGLAGKDPTDGKSQVAQLLAIRWLGEHPDETRKEPKARTTLEQLGQAKQGQVAAVFAREYARVALARLDGKPVSDLRTMPENSLKSDAFAWFPEDVTLFGANDFRASNEKMLDETFIRNLLSRLMVSNGKEEMHRFADNVGNLRLDRISFGYCSNAQEIRRSRIFIRWTGLGNHQWLARFLQQQVMKSAVKEEKGPHGEAITVIGSANQAPAFALVGDTDVIMAGFEGNENALEVLKQALEVQAGRKAGLLNSPRAAKLKELPPHTCALLVGELPEGLRQELTSDQGPFKAFPRQVAIDMSKGRSLALRFQGTMDKAEDAQAFSDGVDKLKQKGVDALQNLPPEIQIKPDSLRFLSQTLEDFQIEVNGTAVSSNLEFPAEEVKGLQGLLGDLTQWALTPRIGPGAGLPVPVAPALPPPIPPRAIPAPVVPPGN